MKKFLYAICMLLVFSLTITPVMAEGSNTAQKQQQKKSVNIMGESAIVTDLETGDVLYEKAKDVERYPASITKIMTALVVLEHLELDDSVTYSEEALNSIESGSSAAYIKPGETLSVEQSLYVMMLHSANDVAHGLAYEAGGDLNGFAQMMNKKAVSLGCQKTHFVNASGLNDPKHYSTASDMAKIAKAAYDNAILRKIMGTTRYVLAPTNKCKSSRTWINGNRMIREGSEYYYKPCLGGKTGYTTVAGGTLVTYAKIKNRILCCVILKSGNSAYAYEDSIKLYKHVEANSDFSKYKTTEKITEKAKDKSSVSAEKKEEEKIIYDAQAPMMQKVILGIKIVVVLFAVLCIGVVLRIVYVQRERKRRRRARARNRRKQRSKRR